MQHAEVGEDVLDPVGQHQRDPVARLQAEFDEGRAELPGQLAGLPPGDRLPGPAIIAVGVRGQAAYCSAVRASTSQSVWPAQACWSAVRCSVISLVTARLRLSFPAPG